MGALTKGRYLSMTGLLLLVYCTVSVISKGKSCVRVHAWLLGLPRVLNNNNKTTNQQTAFMCHPRGYAPLVTFRSCLHLFFWSFANVQLCTFIFQREVLNHARTYCDCWSFLFPQCAAELLMLIHQATAHTVKFPHCLSFFISTSNRCELSRFHSNESIIMTALHPAAGF